MSGEPREDASREPELRRSPEPVEWKRNPVAPPVDNGPDFMDRIMAKQPHPFQHLIDAAYRRGLLRAAEIVNATTFDYEKWDLNSETPPREAFGIGFQAARDYAARAITREADTK